MNKKGMEFETIAKIIIVLVVLLTLILVAKYLNTIKEVVLGLG